MLFDPLIAAHSAPLCLDMLLSLSVMLIIIIIKLTYLSQNGGYSIKNAKRKQRDKLMQLE
jgi:hypothetical protein